MKDKLIIYELIESYLAGNLSGEELADFELRMDEDPELKAEVELHKELEDAIQSDSDEAEFKDRLKEIGKSYIEGNVQSNGKIFQFSFKRLAYAASFLLLIALGAFLFNLYSGAPDSNQLFANNFEAAALTEIQRNNDSDIPVSLKAAYTFYDQKDYASAIPQFENSLQETDLISTRYYLGISYLALEDKDTDKALTNFDYLISDGNNVFITGAKWYKSLILIKNKDLEGAKSLLNELSESQNKYTKRASSLLNSL